MKTRSAIVLSILALGLPLVGCKKNEQPQPTSKGSEESTKEAAPKEEAAAPKEEAAAPALPEPDFTIDARALYAEFRPSIEAGTDEIKNKYTGKVVRISGEVKDNTDMGGTREVTLVANDELGQAFCAFDADASKTVEGLKAGDAVTFQCMSTGWMIGPAFEKCAVVK